MDEDLLNEEVDPMNLEAFKSELAEGLEDSRDAEIVMEAVIEVSVAGLVVFRVPGDFSCRQKG